MSSKSKPKAAPAETPTYDSPVRKQETVTVEKRTLTDDSLTVTWSNGWSFMPPREYEASLHVGTTVIVETRNFSQVCGLFVNGRWLFRKSDHDFAREYQELLERAARDDAEYLEKNRDDLQTRTEALPAWLRDSLEAGLANPEEHPELQGRGWGYELTGRELALLYFQHPEGDDAPEVVAYAEEHGTTGFQHSWAKSAARVHREELDAARAAASGD